MTLVSTKVLGSIVAVLLAVLAFIAASNVKVAVSPVNDVFGAAGQVFSEQVFLNGGATIGGKVIASTTVATETLAAMDIVGVKLLNAKAAAATTMTLPSKSALASAGFLQNAGDTSEWFIHASTSAITLAGATGVSLRSNASSTIVYPLTTAKLTFTRLPAVEGGTYEAIITGMQ